MPDSGSGRTIFWGVSAVGGRKPSVPNPTANLVSTRRTMHIGAKGENGQQGHCSLLLYVCYFCAALIKAAFFILSFEKDGWKWRKKRDLIRDSF